jgi:hypothetical protein
VVSTQSTTRYMIKFFFFFFFFYNIQILTNFSRRRGTVCTTNIKLTLIAMYSENIFNRVVLQCFALLGRLDPFLNNKAGIGRKDRGEVDEIVHTGTLIRHSLKVVLLGEYGHKHVEE